MNTQINHMSVCSNMCFCVTVKQQTYFHIQIPLLRSILQNQLNKNLFSICFVHQQQQSFIPSQLIPAYLATKDNPPYIR